MTEAATKVPTKTSETTPPPAPRARGMRHPLRGLQTEIDRLFDDMVQGIGRWPFGWWDSDLVPFTGPLLGRGGSPAIDLVETEKGYRLTAELPGLDEKDVEIMLSGNTLTIKGEKKEEHEAKEPEYHFSERRYGAFQRVLQLPEGIDSAKIEATFAKGVLTVELPKTPEAAKSERKIDIKGK